VSGPTVAELRAVCQPEAVMGRQTAEHWTGRLYMRRFSIHLTRLLLRTPITANGVTWLMVLAGTASGAALLIPGVVGGALAMLLAQLQMLLDCCDGEVARWRRQFSPAGIFLDKVGHYLAESSIPLCLGVRADGGLGSVGGWTTLGALLSLVIVLNKALNDMVHVARAFNGLPRVADEGAVRAPRTAGLRSLRSAARFLPLHRLYHSIELSALAFLAALVDVAVGGLGATRALVAVLLPAALLTVVGHTAAILASSRLR
jgi:phosphatidylglycerophosphate synthase